jgi:hypothetical protein
MKNNETVMSMRGRRKITNYGGTIHGGAIMALAETVHGGAVLNKIGAFDNLMVTKNCNLTFIKKAKGNLNVCFQLSAEKEAFIKKQQSPRQIRNRINKQSNRYTRRYCGRANSPLSY